MEDLGKFKTNMTTILIQDRDLGNCQTGTMFLKFLQGLLGKNCLIYRGETVATDHLAGKYFSAIFNIQGARTILLTMGRNLTQFTLHLKNVRHGELYRTQSF
jgi:hypothetical protein